MFTPFILILVYLSATFILGLALGWILWKFGIAKQLVTATTEMQYWKDRLEQLRAERNLEQDRFASLERERDNLKKRLRVARADQSA